jgi:hypothetical protein
VSRQIDQVTSRIWFGGKLNNVAKAPLFALPRLTIADLRDGHSSLPQHGQTGLTRLRRRSWRRPAAEIA